MTPFIGREVELAELTDLLDDSDCRLLTLVGPGGIGKTRLAIEVARQKLDAFPDGVYFVPLQPLQFADHLLPAITDALQLHSGEDSKEELLYSLCEKKLLLVLDNFDHVLEGLKLVREILLAAPSVKILVSSRETLKLQQEWVRLIVGLDYPADDFVSQNTPYSAVQLFADRALHVCGNFHLADEWQAVIRICRLVDGIPLALELAAGWTKVLSCREIAEEIAHNLDFLSTTLRDIPAQHRSMRVVLDRSWQRLAVAERDRFARLSVFRGGFDRSGAAQVAGATLGDLATLAEQSWLRVEGGGRYSIQEVLRQYGLEILEATGQLEAVCEAHCAYYAAFVKARETAIKSIEQATVLAEIHVDAENIRAAWQWAVDHDELDRIDRMIECLYWYYWSSGSAVDWALLRRGYHQFMPRLDPQRDPLWAKLVVRACPDYGEAQVERLKRVVEAARGYQDDLILAAANQYLAFMDGWVDADFEAGIQRYQECLILYRRLNDHFAVTDVLCMMGQWSIVLGKLDEARDYLLQSLTMADERQDRIRAAIILSALGDGALFQGDYDRAFTYYSRAEANQQEHRISVCVMRCKGSLAAMTLMRGDIASSRTMVEAMQQASFTIRDKQDQGYWKMVLALICCIETDYHAGQQILMTNITLDTIPGEPIVYMEHFGRTMTAYGLNQMAEAKSHLVSLLDFTVRAHALGLMGWCLPVAALLSAHDGRLEQAAKLVGLALTHPASVTDWAAHWSPFVQLTAELEAKLGPEAYAAAYTLGTRLDIMAVAADLLSEFDPAASRNRHNGSATLSEPLTARELEVLRLVAQGRSDREIADQLVLASGTIKKYGAVIRQKLDAHNRTHAVAIARELGLI